MTEEYSATRRSFLAGAGIVSAAGLSAYPARAASRAGTLSLSGMRGTIDAGEYGIHPATVDDQSRVFQAMLEKASENALAVYLPAGDYVVSNVTLPRNVRLSGVQGATRIVYGGEGHLLAASTCERIELKGIVLDGTNRPLSETVRGLLDVTAVEQLSLENCEIVGSSKSGIVAERTGGRIEHCAISGALDTAIYTINGKAMSIAGNTVTDCGDGGILVHRWQDGPDGAIVSGNRIERIGARSGGTGQNGNGINVFRAAGVMVTNNSITDCAFSAIRSNSGSDVQITGNQCLRSGETAVYCEFAFEGAVIANNLIDEAANGISIVNFDHGGRLAVCSNNLVRNLTNAGPYEAGPAGFGIGISAEADTAITGNVIEGAPTFGLQIGWGEYLRDVVANANIVRECGTGIAVSAVKGAGPALISGNVISRSKDGAIVGYAWDKPATRDLAKSTLGHPVNITVERNHVS